MCIIYRSIAYCPLCDYKEKRPRSTRWFFSACDTAMNASLGIPDMDRYFRAGFKFVTHYRLDKWYEETSLKDHMFIEDGLCTHVENLPCDNCSMLLLEARRWIAGRHFEGSSFNAWNRPALMLRTSYNSDILFNALYMSHWNRTMVHPLAGPYPTNDNLRNPLLLPVSIKEDWKWHVRDDPTDGWPVRGGANFVPRDRLHGNPRLFRSSLKELNNIFRLCSSLPEGSSLRESPRVDSVMPVVSGFDKLEFGEQANLTGNIGAFIGTADGVPPISAWEMPLIEQSTREALEDYDSDSVPL